MRRFLLLILVILSVYRGTAQDLSNIRSGEIFITSDSLLLDTLSIIPGSLFLFDPEHILIPDSLYSVDYSSASIKFDTILRETKISLTYRVFPVNFSKPYARKDTTMINKYLKPGTDPFRITGAEVRSESSFLTDEMIKRGSISRGIVVGNNQDLVVNSNLNLQLAGKISDDLRIAAAISDNNIPIQPDGTTQDIHEFDRVYIEIYNESMSLLAGDFDLMGSPGNFLKFYKKGKGARFMGNFKLNNETSSILRTTVSASVSKGLVCRNSFTGKEGNQGPYKLRGSNNEQFIIVLAGTERVYINGRLLSRGLENDYTIDYNNAEITFTPNQLITKDKRIIIEFEYSEKSYARFLVYNSNEIVNPRSHFWINVYSEQDAKNQTLQQDLSKEDKEILAGIGDELDKAIVPRIDSVEFNSAEVLYKKVDTSILDITYQDVFIYSTHPDSACYRLGFSYVGTGNGNYIPVKSSANGKVYRWIEPVNGMPSGDFEPVVLLVTPKKKQVISLGGKITPTSSTNSFGEITFTNNNLNTFSDLDKNDNAGFALKGGIIQDLLLKDTSMTSLKLNGTYQFISNHFDPVERFRPVEFERDWNLTGNYSGYFEHLVDIKMDLYRKELFRTGLETEYLNRGNIYQGFRNTFYGSAHSRGFIFDFNGSLMNSNDSLLQTRFIRHQALLSKQIKSVLIGIREESEMNTWNNQATDSLENNSFRYFQYELFLSGPDTAKNSFLLNYRARKDYLPIQNELNLATTGKDFNFGIRLDKNPSNRLKATLTYRWLEIHDKALINVKNDQSLFGRLEHSLRILKGGIISSTFYEIGSGLEAKKEFTYLEVTPGQGVYSWTDYNGNNVMELDEFDIAGFQDQARFIRVFTPTEAFINVYTNQFSQSLQLQPVRFWNNNTGLRKAISLFSDQFVYSLNRKNSDIDLIRNLNPFYTPINSHGLISLSTSVRNNLSFNKSGSKFGLDYIFQRNGSRIMLANGFDDRTLVSHGSRIRWSHGNDISIINQTDAGNKSFNSESFLNRNYDIRFIVEDLSFQYQPGISYRVIVRYLYSDEKNKPGIEHSGKHDISVETKYSKLSKGTVTAKLSYVHIDYNQDPNTPVAYEMLKGFLPGSNGVWEIAFQRSLTGGLEFNLDYSGRVSENQKIIHFGGVQVSWNF